MIQKQYYALKSNRFTCCALGVVVAALALMFYLAIVPSDVSSYAGRVIDMSKDVRTVSVKTDMTLHEFLQKPGMDQFRHALFEIEMFSLKNPNMSLDEIMATDTFRCLQQEANQLDIEEQELLQYFVLTSTQQSGTGEPGSTAPVTPAVLLWVAGSLRAIQVSLKLKRAYHALTRARQAYALAQKGLALAKQATQNVAATQRALAQARIVLDLAKQKMLDETVAATLQFTLASAAALAYAQQWLAKADEQSEEDKNPICEEAKGIMAVLHARYHANMSIEDLDAMRLSLELDRGLLVP